MAPLYDFMVNNHLNIYLHVSCLQAVLVESLMTVGTQSSICSTTTGLTTTTAHKLVKPLVGPSPGTILQFLIPP